MVGTADGYAAGLGDFTVARQRVPALQFRSLGKRLAPEVGRKGGAVVRSNHRISDGDLYVLMEFAVGNNAAAFVVIGADRVQHTHFPGHR
jgi:hypothetical protein